MNLKKILTTLSFLLLLSCGYEPIHSKKKNNNTYKFSINTINYIGDSEANKILKNKLKRILDKKKKSTELNLNIDSRIEKVITSKNKKGNPITFSIEIIISLEVFENGISKDKTNFKKNFEYNNKSNKFDLNQYEKNIKDNLISKLSNEIIRYLNYLG